MWQLFGLGGVLSTAIEGVIDKVALVADEKKIDSLVATFWRCFTYLLWMLAIGAIGIFGPLTFTFSPIIFAVAAGSILNSFFYTLLLQRIEVTSIGAIAYVAPFLFLIIDSAILHTSFTTLEIIGIIFLVFGSLGFTIDRNTLRFKKELSLAVWGMLLFTVLYAGAQAYAFKYAHFTLGMNSVSFLTSYDFVDCVGLIAIILMMGNVPLLWNKSARVYAPRMGVSKFFDATSTILLTQALTLAAVSQVSAMATLEPLALVALTFIAQKFLRMHAEEKFEREHLVQKIAAVALLVAGGFLVS